ncbi:MAG: CHAT domain-containing protein [Saprospiraceae bacterium]|nr:CHAT domain-containing protein [Saprospiraceae bacterium]
MSGQETNLDSPIDLIQNSYAELDSLMYLAYSKGYYKKAIPYMLAGREKAEQEFGKQDSVYVEYTSNLGFFYFQTAQYDKAEPIFLEAKNIRTSIYGIQDPSYAQSLNDLAVLYKQMGRFAKAEPLYLESKKIKAKFFGTEHPAYATVVNNLAVFYKNTGDYNKAEPMYFEAIKIRAKALGKEHPRYAESLNNLASLYHDMGRYSEAELLYQEVKNIRAKALGKEHPRYAQILNNLGSLYQDLNQFEEAELLFLESMQIREKVLGKEHPSYSISLNNLAALYKDMHKYESSESLYLESLELHTKNRGKETIFYANAMHNLGALYSVMGRYKDVLPFYRKAIDISGRIVGLEHPRYASNLNHLATIFYQLNLLDSAFLYCIESLDANSIQIDSSFYFRDSSFSDFFTLDTFDYYSNQQAIKSISLLLDIIKSAYNQINLKNLDSLELLSREQYLGEKTLEQHYMLAQTAMRLNESIRNNFISEADKLRTLRSNISLVTQGIESALLLNKDIYIRDAFSFSEQNKSILLSDAIKGDRARAFGDLPDSLSEKEIRYHKQITDLKRKQYSAKSKEEKDLINHSLGELNLEIDVFLKSLKDKFPRYHSLKYENITARSSDVQDLLDDKTLLLEYFQTDQVLYLFVISKDKVELIPLDVSKNILKEKIQQFRYAISSYTFITEQRDKNFRLYTQCAHWFFKELIEAGIQDKKVENLIIVADGELGHLPFGAFLVEPAPQKTTSFQKLHYLINDYNISYNYSATLWKENLTRKKEVHNYEILGCAAYYQKVDSSLLKIRLPYFFNLRGKLNPLPAAQKEIAALADNFKGEFLLKDSTNEHFFKENAYKYGIIHLAMHGVLDARTPMLSSLVFTENRDSLEDNFLQAFEIARLKLKADLVVLSACETGYGEYEQGEGVISLARSFMYAGVPSLVVSLWQVNDNSTVQLMTSFYQNLAEGMPKDLALRKAKLTYLKNAKGIMAHPVFWSPFIQLGDNSSVELVNKNKSNLWLIYGGIFFVLLFGVFYVLRKKEYKFS